MGQQIKMAPLSTQYFAKGRHESFLGHCLTGKNVVYLDKQSCNSGVVFPAQLFDGAGGVAVGAMECSARVGLSQEVPLRDALVTGRADWRAGILAMTQFCRVTWAGEGDVTEAPVGLGFGFQADEW